MKEWMNSQGGNEGDLKLAAWVGAPIVIGLVGYTAWKKYGPTVVSETKQAINTTIDVGLDMLTYGSVGLAVLGGTYVASKLLYRPKMTVLKITPSLDTDVDINKVVEMTQGFSTFVEGGLITKKKHWIKWLITKDLNGVIQFRVLVPDQFARRASKKIKLAYPTAVLEQNPEGIDPFYQKGIGSVGLFKMSVNNKAFGLTSSDSNRMGDLLTHMPKGAVMEIAFSPTKITEIAEESRRGIGRILNKREKLVEDNEMKKEIHQRYHKRKAFDVALTVWAKNGVREFAKEVAQITEGENRLEFKEFTVLPDLRNPLNYDGAPFPWRVFQLNDKELAQFFRLPPIDHAVREQIEVMIPKKKPAVDDFKPQWGYSFGLIDHPDVKDRQAKVNVTTLVNHSLIAGMSGGGKGSVLHTFLDDFLKDWATNSYSPGFTYADPHLYGALGIINLLLDMEQHGYKIPWDRVKCFSVGDLGTNSYPVAMNLLHRHETESVDNVVEDAVDIIMSAFSGDLSRSKVYLTNAIYALLGASSTHTIADISKLYIGSEDVFRNNILQQVKNPSVSQWWTKQEAKFLDNNNEPTKDINVDAVDTRLNPFLAKLSMQRLFCQSGNNFDVQSIFKNGDLVLVDFLGAPDEAYKLVAGWLASKYFREAQRRGKGGRPHFLVFDEVQKFDVPVFTKIIKENRKFNMGLMLMTQEVENLDTTLRDTIKNNAGAVISVRQEAGAEQMAKLLNQEFSAETLRRMNKGQEAVIRSFDGSANLKIRYPAYRLNGKPTNLDSPEEEEAIKIAEEKFIELMKRDCKHYTEVDHEVESLIAGRPIPVQKTDEKDKPAKKKTTQVQKPRRRKITEMSKAESSD